MALHQPQARLPGLGFHILPLAQSPGGVLCAQAGVE